MLIARTIPETIMAHSLRSNNETIAPIDARRAECVQLPVPCLSRRYWPAGLVAGSAAAQDKHVLRHTSAAPITVQSVQQLLEDLDFTFEASPLADGTPRMLGQRSTTLVELYGTTDLVQAVLLGIASKDDQSVNVVIIAGIAALMNATAPSKVDWVLPAMKRAIARSERHGTGVASTSAAG